MMKEMQIFSSVRMPLAFVMIPLLQKELDTFKDTILNLEHSQDLTTERYSVAPWYS